MSTLCNSLAWPRAGPAARRRCDSHASMISTLLWASALFHTVSAHQQTAVAPPKAASEMYHFSFTQAVSLPLGCDLRHAGVPACGAGTVESCNTDLLKVLCLNTPACTAFSSSGWLKNCTVPSVPTPGLLDIFTKLPGRPTTMHYLRVPGWDGLSTGGDLYHVNSNDPSILEAACNKDPACAGFNSNGYLKSCVADIGSVNGACDLYIKLGGSTGPALPPVMPPVPPPPPPSPLHGGPWAPQLWPLPKNYTNGSATLIVQPISPGAPLFQLDPGVRCKTLTTAFARYEKLTLPHNTPPPSTVRPGTLLNVVKVQVEDISEAHPQLETDESYSLTVPVGSPRAILHAKTIYGALRGLETFSQLVVFDFDKQRHTLPLAPWSITDAPRFPHRGLMIDCSRHFLPLQIIRRTIDSLPYAKLNVLHWHMSDTQSFPFQSTTSPLLDKEGAYSKQERYTRADVAEVVEYSRERGIRVMVEFDMPGHAGSWCKGYPEVCPSPSCTQPLNPARNATWTLIEGLLGECTGKAPLSELFPEKMIHLGGDEVDTSCWREVPAITDWLEQQGLSTDAAYGYFVNRTAHIAVEQSRRPVQWNEVWDHFGSSLPKEAIIHSWNDRSAVAEATDAGYFALNSQGWYFDNLDATWEEMYVNDPTQGVESVASQSRVLGGHGEMWGETVDASDFEETVWPRLAAVAEQLWSPQEVTDCAADFAVSGCANCFPLDTAFPRLSAFRCLLNRRGVRAAPLRNTKAREAPPGPDSCLNQR